MEGCPRELLQGSSQVQCHDAPAMAGAWKGDLDATGLALQNDFTLWSLVMSSKQPFVQAQWAMRPWRGLGVQSEPLTNTYAQG